MCGPPGSGKTRFLDEVAALFVDEGKRKAAFELAGLSDDDRELLTPIFERLVPIVITYRNGNYCQDNSDRHLHPGIGVPVLFRFLLNPIHSYSPLKCLFWQE